MVLFVLGKACLRVPARQADEASAEGLQRIDWKNSRTLEHNTPPSEGERTAAEPVRTLLRMRHVAPTAALNHPGQALSGRPLNGLRERSTTSTTLSAWAPEAFFGTTVEHELYQVGSKTGARYFMPTSLQVRSEPEPGFMVNGMKSLGAKTVLCVDDEAIGLRVRKIMLEAHGFKVLTANSGKQGLDVFDQHHVDLVILDYYMPGMNGGDVAEEMRRRRPAVPIIFLSAYFSLPVEALELANAFITKGDPPDVLIRKIEQLV